MFHFFLFAKEKNFIFHPFSFSFFFLLPSSSYDFSYFFCVFFLIILILFLHSSSNVVIIFVCISINFLFVPNLRFHFHFVLALFLITSPSFLNKKCFCIRFSSPCRTRTTKTTKKTRARERKSLASPRDAALPKTVFFEEAMEPPGRANPQKTKHVPSFCGCVTEPHWRTLFTVPFSIFFILDYVFADFQSFCEILRKMGFK